uniref:Uncharacterized protein n=1 Tax=Rhizophora mucronata TaxID=61149 RepID=A0A2P2PTQ5_RHIMU
MKTLLPPMITTCYTIDNYTKIMVVVSAKHILLNS